MATIAKPGTPIGTFRIYTFMTDPGIVVGDYLRLEPSGIARKLRDGDTLQGSDFVAISQNANEDPVTCVPVDPDWAIKTAMASG